LSSPNALRWNGRPGHYEVYYLTLTDAVTGTGFWIRYTLLAPDDGVPSCALWFLAMDPAQGVTARKATFPIAQLTSADDPFRFQVGSGTLTDGAADGELEDAAWSLRWNPGRRYQHVCPALRPLATTVLCLPHGDVGLEGQIRYAGRTVELAGARGADQRQGQSGLGHAAQAAQSGAAVGIDEPDGPAAALDQSLGGCTFIAAGHHEEPGENGTGEVAVEVYGFTK